MRTELYENIVNYIVENQNKFYRLAFSYARNQEDALDIVQNAICKALDHYETLNNQGAVKTWFYRILVNESIQFIKKRNRELLSGDDSLKEEPYYEKGYEGEGDLYDQINCLNEDVQKIIKLRFYEEMSLQEISDITQLNLNTVKAKLYRGLKLLKQTIQEVEA